MDSHALYFVGYALMATVLGIVIAKAQHNLKKKEGKPINYTILKVVFGIALLMWTGAALTSVAYNATTSSSAVAGMFLGIILSLFFGWQINVVIRKIQSDEKEIEELSTHDALTGLCNRRLFHEYLNAEMTRSRRFNNPLSLMMIDIDDFESINESFGYEGGDKILREIGKLLMKTARSIDHVCRYRSKEIGIILTETNLESAEQFAKRLQGIITSHAFDGGASGRPASITVSIGVATYSDKIDTESALVAAVERALDVTKEQGAGGIYVDRG